MGILVDESHWFTLALSVACAFVFTVRRLRTLNKHSSMAEQPKKIQNAAVADVLAMCQDFQSGTAKRTAEGIVVGGAISGVAQAEALRGATARIQARQALEALESGGAGGDGEEPPHKKAKKADQKFEIVMELLVAMMGEVDGVKAYLALRAPACALDSAGITSRLP